MRLKSTLDDYLKDKEVIHLSKEASDRIDRKISDAFYNELRNIEKRQLNSWYISKKYRYFDC